MPNNQIVLPDLAWLPDMVVLDEDQAEILTSVLRDYVLRDSPDEHGAEKHRFKVEKIDPSKGSATGYVAKYISKSIDGYGLDEDLDGNEASTAAERIVAWASVWKIRQFQTRWRPSCNGIP